MENEVITRFAPSPTGHLHLGGARTALFNYLFAKSQGGKFLLRIEDTDIERSKPEYYESIISSLKWLQIDWDGEIIFQSKRTQRYLEVANQMLANGTAYKCFVSQEEIEKQRQESEAKGKRLVFHSPWRNSDTVVNHSINESVFNQSNSSLLQNFVVRLKTPLNTEIVVDDKVQGLVTFSTNDIDDQVLVRSNGNPTYMLSVVVDDHDMKVTDIIRGDDHLINTPKQILIYRAMGWQIPRMYHIPLIHGADGAQLSKRHGATNMVEYQNNYLPKAIRNYFLNLGWHSDKYNDKHGDVMSLQDAINIFDSRGFKKSAARIDSEKLKNINAQNIRRMSEAEVFGYLSNYIDKNLSVLNSSNSDIRIFLEPHNKKNISLALSSILERAKLLEDIFILARIYINEFIPSTDLKDEIVIQILEDTIRDLKSNKIIFTGDVAIDRANIENHFKGYSKLKNFKLGEVMKTVRIGLTGMSNSPSLFELIAILGKDITLKRFEINNAKC